MTETDRGVYCSASVDAFLLQDAASRSMIPLSFSLSRAHTHTAGIHTHTGEEGRRKRGRERNEVEGNRLRWPTLSIPVERGRGGGREGGRETRVKNEDTFNPRTLVPAARAYVRGCALNIIRQMPK